MGHLYHGYVSHNQRVNHNKTTGNYMYQHLEPGSTWHEVQKMARCCIQWPGCDPSIHESMIFFGRCVTYRTKIWNMPILVISTSSDFDPVRWPTGRRQNQTRFWGTPRKNGPHDVIFDHHDLNRQSMCLFGPTSFKIVWYAIRYTQNLMLDNHDVY